MAAVTNEQCEKRRRGTAKWPALSAVFAAFGIALTAAIAISMGASNDASDAMSDHASQQEFKENVQRSLDGLQTDVREVRRVLLRIEKNGGSH